MGFNFSPIPNDGSSINLGGLTNSPSSSGSLFDSITNGLSTVGSAISDVLGTFSDIKTKKEAIRLQKAQVDAEIAKIKADQALQAATASVPVFTIPNGGNNISSAGAFSLGSIPPWIILAGAFGAFFMLRGAVK